MCYPDVVRRILLVVLVVCGLLVTPARADEPYLSDLPVPRCAGHAQPGAVAFARWLGRQLGHGRLWQIYRCDRPIGGWDFHAEGRAIDWWLDARVPAHRAAAKRVRTKLTRGDGRLARAMGIQAVLWNCRAWDLVSRRYHPGALGYDGLIRVCDPNDRDCYGRPGGECGWDHRDHIHVEMSWRGAKMRTSFWRGRRP